MLHAGSIASRRLRAGDERIWTTITSVTGIAHHHISIGASASGDRASPASVTHRDATADRR
jgi:hypothetical protein